VTTKKHIFIINLKSFLTKKSLETMEQNITDYFAGAGGGDFEIHHSRYPRNAIGIVRTILKDLPADVPVRVYAIGGDGILFDCVNGVMGFPNAELANLPYGSSNDFIRSFGENKADLFRSVKLQVEAPVIPTDVIDCVNNYGINTCCIGVEGESAVKVWDYMEKMGHYYRRILTFLFRLGAVLALFDRRLINQRYQIDIDDECYDGNYSNIHIGNGPCLGDGMCVTPRSLPNDGVVDVVLARTRPFVKNLFNYLRFSQGKVTSDNEDFICRQAKSITISSDFPLAINLDGEVIFDKSFTVRVIPGAVKFAAVKGLPYLRRKNE
jgi:diacylglycerol kinase family enzyme